MVDHVQFVNDHVIDTTIELWRFNFGGKSLIVEIGTVDVKNFGLTRELGGAWH